MKRYETLTNEAKWAFAVTVQNATVHGTCNFACTSSQGCVLLCKDCPFDCTTGCPHEMQQSKHSHNPKYTVLQWLEWATEDAEHDAENATEHARKDAETITALREALAILGETVKRQDAEIARLREKNEQEDK